MQEALYLENVTKRYRDYTLDHVGFTLPSGCIMGLIGENGAGKSTTIKAITGAVRPDEGIIRVLGCDTGSADFQRKKQEIGVVMDEACFPDELTPKQVDRVMAGFYENWEKDTFYGWLDRFQLPQKKRFQEFSRGMKMKLSLAAALSHNAKLLLLDEATGGLDPMTRDEILDVFNDFTREEEHSILISSHIVTDLEKICDYVTFLHQGRVLFCEEKDEILEKYGILHVGKKEFEAICPEAVVSARKSEFGVEAVVKRGLLPDGMQIQRAGIEEIIVAIAKEGRA